MEKQEIECRFLEINKDELVKRLVALGATDEGEKMLEEIIYYGPDGTWQNEERFVRLRKSGEKTKLTYKEHRTISVGGAYELEFEVEDMQKMNTLFERIGFPGFRHQQKKRHTLQLGPVTFDIDTWPRIPTYVEIEGPSEEALQQASTAVGYDWSNVELHDAAWVIKNKYGFDVKSMKWFTFDKFE